MTWLNTNAVHNALNIAIAVVAALMAFDWNVLMEPATAAKVIAGLASAKLMINAVRDGLSGLVKPQPPVGSTTN